MPERSDTRRFLERRQAVRPRQYCFWAVLSDSDARQVATWHRFGEREVALQLLQRCDVELGRILPGPQGPSICA
jgi:hypothetical protein